jgi:hypothetical protein
MTKERNAPLSNTNDTCLSLLLANYRKSYEESKEKFELIRIMKAMQYDLRTIFDVTGLPPEIIQSL